jgi:predicted nucleic acid-binding protein
MEEAIVNTNVLVYDMIEDSVFHEKAASLLDA